MNKNLKKQIIQKFNPVIKIIPNKLYQIMIQIPLEI